MFVIQYMLTSGTWCTMYVCGSFTSWQSARDYMDVHCASVIYKRVKWQERG